MPSNSNIEENVKAGSEPSKQTGTTGTAAVRHRKSEHELDDQGTDQFEAAELLRRIRDEVFDGSNDAFALALGRPVEEIETWTSGALAIDGDVVLKARALAQERGMDIE